MSVASRPVSTGKTRTCPHCKATILESLSICPGCMHHLRFDSEAAKRQVAAAPALRVEGIIRHPPLEQPLEYFVIIAIRNDRGEEVTRQVVNVGALQAAEKRTFTLSVEVLPPQAPAPTKSTSATGTFKAPLSQPTATVRPAAPAPGATSAGSSATGAAPVASDSGPSGFGLASSGSASGAVNPGAVAKPASSGGAVNPPAAGKPASSGSPVNPAAGGKPASSGSPVNPAAAAKPASSGSPGNPGAPGSSSGAGTPGSPGSPAKPASGYVLKPPSPGGPKRH